jgi:stress response protein YsnF
MKPEYDGLSVLDSEGNSIGKVEETYIDTGNTPQFVSVRTGTLFHKHHLVPLDDAMITNDGLQLPYTKDQVEGGPQVNPDDSLEGDVLQRTRAYYTGAGGVATEMPAAQAPSSSTDQVTTSSDSNASDTAPASRSSEVPLVASQDGRSLEELRKARDLGDVVEVPVVEERLVRQPVVREVVRVTKQSTTETQTVGADLRSEDVQVDADDGILAGRDTTGTENP